MKEVLGMACMELNLDELDYRDIGECLAELTNESLEIFRKYFENVLRVKFRQPTPDSRLYKILTHDLEVVNFELWRRKQIVVMGEFKKRRSMKELRCLTTIVTLILMTIYPTPRPSNAPQLPLFFDCA
ncbi:uncharacterized protein LOC126748372 isoform X2 [Anthonomus grandis grandis]|uniref:uncharacterized protein LOC126748372 isoform X2 n=1 Tax=Anthonomus grandis grandis TaxID=2921223 RepID=UPI0021661C9B|nr:uncharacterized protein LOC126748372 isoform X2 [Anthonomus grandis grandis]